MAGFKQPRSVLVVIYTPQLDVLLLQRTDRPDYWQSVTGSCEIDEAPLLTAQRELHEETGLTLGDGELRDWQQQNHYEIYAHWRHRYAPGVTHNTEFVYGFCLPSTLPVTIAPREHLAYQWLPWQTAAAQAFSPSNQAAILQLPQQVSKVL